MKKSIVIFALVITAGCSSRPAIKLSDIKCAINPRVSILGSSRAGDMQTGEECWIGVVEQYHERIYVNAVTDCSRDRNSFSNTHIRKVEGGYLLDCKNFVVANWDGDTSYANTSYLSHPVIGTFGDDK